MSDDAQHIQNASSQPNEISDEAVAESSDAMATPENDRGFVEDGVLHNSVQDAATGLADEYLRGWRRAKADYENLKKEVERERKEMGAFARTMVAMDFIPIYDNFKKAAAHEPEFSDSEESKRFKQWIDGVRHIQSQFREVLKQIGIEEISTVGSPFDPRVHEAVEEREGAGVPPGHIVAEVSGGYKMGERVLQAAKVIIAK